MSVSLDGDFLQTVIGGDGVVQADRLVTLLRVTKGELAIAFGLSRDAISKTDRLTGRATQTRLREST